MQLPDFISRAVGFFTKIETRIDSELAAANSRNEALTADLQQCTLTIKELRGALETVDAERSAAAEVAAKLTEAQTEIERLKAEVEAERIRANETIAAQGLPHDAVPAATTSTVAPGEGHKTVAETYANLLVEDPVKAARFFAEHRDELTRIAFSR
jgi:hypothetical protein